MENTNKEVAKGLRELADVIETCEVTLFGSVIPQIQSFAVNDKDDFVTVTRHFAPVDKDFSGDSLATIVRNFGPVGFYCCVNKAKVCRKVTKMQEVEVWECDPILEAK